MPVDSDGSTDNEPLDDEAKMQIEKWPLVQAYALDEFQSGKPAAAPAKIHQLQITDPFVTAFFVFFLI